MKRPESVKLAVDTLTPSGSRYMTETEPKLRQRTVGRLDRTRDPEILNAALDVLTENGYDATNMNDIAARAGVGKAAIYRRWASKAALITDTLVYWRPDLLTNDTPDTGSLAGDLDALVERVGRNENDMINNDLVLRVAFEATRDPGLASALDDLMLFRGKRVLSTILAHAAARGELSGDRDWSLGRRRGAGNGPAAGRRRTNRKRRFRATGHRHTSPTRGARTAHEPHRRATQA
jgi:AcrR family transcriptional regulator